MNEPHIDLDEYPDSPYAAELRRSSVSLRFVPRLEATFRTFHLARAIRHVRVWQLLILILGAGTAMKRTLPVQPGMETEALLRWLVLVPLCTVITIAAWSKNYQRWYYRAAIFGMPIVAVVSTALIALMISEGGYEALAYLTVSIFAAYLLVGALFYQGAALTFITILSFVVGGLLVDMPMKDLGYITSIIAITAGIATLVSYNMELSNRQAFLERGLLAEMAVRDGLTTLRNRRTLDEQLQKLWRQAIRDRQSITLLLIDLDHFKSFNDLLGHPAGDETLRRVSQVVKGAARRPLDIAARYGGEELAVVLYQANPERVRDIADALRATVEQLGIRHPGSTTASVVTVSIGAVSLRASHSEGPHALIRAADEALYMAKNSGRNRVHVATVGSQVVTLDLAQARR